MDEYMNKFSFGLSLNIELEQYEKIIEQFKPFLNSVYFSLPFGDEFHTRMGVRKEYSDKNALKKLLNILELFKKKGIKLEAIINQYHIDLNKLKSVLDYVDELFEVDSICCLDEYFEIINNHYNGKMYIISSFNNGIVSINNIDCYKNYNMLVLGKQFLRNIEDIKLVKQKGFDIKLLINNGCAFNCYSCREGQRKCVEVFKNNLKFYTPEQLYAKQSFFPWELKKLFVDLKGSQYIDEIKLSSRPCTYKYLKDCLESYIYNRNEKKYIEETTKNYHLWGRQANLIEYFSEFDVENLNKIKEKLWEKYNEKDNRV